MEATARVQAQGATISSKLSVSILWQHTVNFQRLRTKANAVQPKSHSLG